MATTENHLTPVLAEEHIPAILSVYFPNRRDFPQILVQAIDNYVALRLYMSQEDILILYQEDIVAVIVSHLRTVCLCGNEYSTYMWTILITNLLLENVTIPLTCSHLKAALVFMLYENRCPSATELESFQCRQQRLLEDADQYARDEDVVLVLDLKSTDLMSTTYEQTETEVCSLCQTDICHGQDIYELPCKHIFHADVSQCLPDMSIVDWFRSHRRCPNCNTEVIYTAHIAQ